MGKRLYEVTIEHTLFVMAESRQEAKGEALRNVREEGPESVIPREVTSHRHPVPPHWRDSYPWGGDLDKTVGELVAAMAPAEPPKERA